MKKLNNYCTAIDTLQKLSEYDYNDYANGNELIYNNLVSGYINHFEITFELAWKLQKQILEYEGVSEAKTGSPRTILCLSKEFGLISDSKAWTDALSDRNDSSHIYNSEVIYKMRERIKTSYLPIFSDLVETSVEHIKRLYENGGLPAEEIDDKLLELLTTESDTPDLTQNNGRGVRR